MLEWSSLWWPEADIQGKRNIAADAMMNMGKLLSHVERRGTAVQAGGNVGLYPLALGHVFRTVHTFEPEAENYNCLLANLKRHPRSGEIISHYAALGEAPGGCRLTMNIPVNTGTYRVDGPGEIPMLTIDGLGLKECDLIWLDVEGWEWNVLRGAVETINRCKPVIIFEENGLSESPLDWLSKMNYVKIAKHRHDCLMAPK